MCMFTLAISCLTTSNFLDSWTYHSRFLCNIALQHQTLLPSSVLSITGCYFCFGSVSSFFLKLLLHWSLVAYWVPTNLGRSSFRVLSFCLLILFMGFSRQECWIGSPFPSPVDHVFSVIGGKGDRELGKTGEGPFVQSLSCVWLFVTPWTASFQVSLSFTTSQRSLKLMSIELMMPSNHLILCHPLFYCLQSCPTSGSFPLSWLLTSGSQSTGMSVSASVLPMNTQGWFSLGLTGLISFQSKGLSRVFTSTIVWKHQFFRAQPSLWSNSHMTTGKTTGKNHSFDHMSQVFNVQHNEYSQ